MKDLLFDYRLYFDDPEPEPEPDPSTAEENVNESADFEPAVSIDVTTRIVENIKELQEALGITNMIPMGIGTAVKIYKTTVTKPASQVGEGEDIPLSKVERKLADTIILGIDKFRRATTMEAIQKVGQAIALNEADSKLIGDVRKSIKTKFFGMIESGTGSATGGTGLQAAVASAWAAIQAYYVDTDTTPIYFINSTDFATYMGGASIVAQEKFAMTYIQDFMGLGRAILTPTITAGKVYATVTENLNGVYVPVNGGDVGNSFNMIADETGMVGITHSIITKNATIESLLATGATFYVEDLSGVFKSTIS